MRIQHLNVRASKRIPNVTTLQSSQTERKVLMTRKKSPQSNRILYVGFYDTPEHSHESRDTAPAATDKMDYIIDVLTEIGYEVEIVSASVTRGKRRQPGRVTEIRSGVWLRQFPTLPWGNKLQRIASVVYSKWRMFYFLLRHTKRGENVVVYHSLGYNQLVEIAHRLRGFRLVLEVEEIYADQTIKSTPTTWMERLTIARADAYLYSTQLLRSAIDHGDRPHVVVHGTYRPAPTVANSLAPVDDKVHVVYAGVVDTHKGSFRAVDAARHLTGDYRLHIIGFGSNAAMKGLQDRIETVNKESKCQVSYDGLLRGVAYESFLQSCRIGVIGQSGRSTFANTSFPSKILSYMANGLTVVSDRFGAVEQSALGNSLVYTTGESAEHLANAIMRAATEPRDSRQVLLDLHSGFAAEMRELLLSQNRRLLLPDGNQS